MNAEMHIAIPILQTQPSIHQDADRIRRFGGAYKIVFLPDTLKMIQRGRDLLQALKSKAIAQELHPRCLLIFYGKVEAK